MMTNVRERDVLLKSFICFIMNSKPNCEKCQHFIKNERDRTSTGFCRKFKTPIYFPNSPRCGGILYEP